MYLVVAGPYAGTMPQLIAQTQTAAADAGREDVTSMYAAYFGIEGRPFSIAPDPRFLYLSDRHREALAHLLFGLNEGGFVQLTGEVGTGKTTLCRALLEQIPERVDVALLLNPRLDALELVAAICDELGVAEPEDPRSLRQRVDALNRHLLRTHAEGRRTVVIIDEAQNLDPGVLEQVRLLTNLETAEEKLLQIILIGQPELRVLLACPELRQLAQRITARYHLEPLDAEETRGYVRHRLRVAGCVRPLFTRAALARVHRLTGGIPRLINILCDRALLGAYVEDADRVGLRILSRAAREVLPPTHVAASTGPRWPWLLAGGLLVATAAAAAWWYHDRPSPVPTAETAAVPEPPALSAPVIAPDSVPIEPAQWPPPGIDASELLAAAAERPDAAWAALFRGWGYALPEGLSDAAACRRAEAAGLRCLAGRGAWAQLLQLDRPALLWLRDAQGAEHPVLLRAVQGEQVTLEAGGMEAVWPLDTLSRHWMGRHLLLWRPLAEGAVLRPGMRHPAVATLREALMRGGFAPASTTGDPQWFDAQLEAAVRRFQRERGLQADGIVGARTQMKLNELPGAAQVPRLQSGPAA